MMGIRRGCRVVLTIVLCLQGACFLFVSPANAQDHERWAAQVSADSRSYFTDEPNCHPSDYFAHDAHHFLYQQTFDLNKEQFLEDTFMAKRIGEVSGYNVSEYDHLINQSSPNGITVKILLVERKAKELCEIYHQEWASNEVQVQPAHLVTIGQDAILATTDAFSGNSGALLESYWTFDKDGPLRLGVREKIDEILKKLLPKGLIIMNGGGFDVRTLTYGQLVWKAADPHCCPTGGSIEIKFALRDHQLVVVSQSYKKN